MELSAEEIARYAHSPVHLAVARRDYAALRRILSTLPRLPRAGEVTTEEQSILAEQRADVVSASIDRRDVAGRETALHVAVRMGDVTSVEMLMSAGADWSLQNEQGWSALQEAVCARQDAIAMIITRHYQPLAWAKWCRRLPRVIATAGRMRDFYMEITFHFESSVIPFVGRIAPSDTYRIWKRGSNLRADMTLAGFDGFRIQRSDQSFLFLGEGSEDDRLSPGSLIVLTHKEKEITNALEGAGIRPSDAEVAQEVALMSQTNMYRPGIDVTQAELVPHLNWRRQDRTEMVGPWKAKIHDMLHVMVSVKSRRVPGAMTDEELFTVEGDRLEGEPADYDDILTQEEKEQLDNVLRMEHSEGFEDDDGCGFFGSPGHCENGKVDPDRTESGEADGEKDKKGSWFGWNRKALKDDSPKIAANLRNNAAATAGEVDKPCPGEGHGSASGVVDEDPSRILKRFSRLAPDGTRRSVDHRASDFQKDDGMGVRKGKEKAGKGSGKKEAGKKKSRPGGIGDSKHESEYKKGLRPVLWLSPDFPLKTDEFLPLLDILANKVKAVRRLRELLTTKLPPGTFPVKVAIPIVPTIRVVITFTKFEELQPSEEFSTPLSSPAYFQDVRGKDAQASQSSSSWMSWMRGSYFQAREPTCLEDHLRDDLDPFHIPSDYTWIDMNEKKRRMKAKRIKNKKGKRHTYRNAEGSLSDVEE